MSVKKEKMTDGLFIFEQVTITMNESEQDIEQAFDELFPSLSDDLNSIEKRLNELILRNDEELSKRRNPKLKNKIDRTKHLNAVKSYAENGLFRLNLVRSQVDQGNTKDAVWNTILMMDNYWRSYFHTIQIKAAILNDAILTKQKREAAKTERFEDIELEAKRLAQEKWSRKPNRSVNEIAGEIHAELSKEYEHVPTTRTITKYIKDMKP